MGNTYSSRHCISRCKAISASCMRLVVSKTLPQFDDRYASCSGQSTCQRSTSPEGKDEHTLISATFQSLTTGFEGSLFHWKYTPLTTSSAFLSTEDIQPTMSEKCLWVLPFVWLELPCLASREDTDNSIPGRQYRSERGTYQAS